LVYQALVAVATNSEVVCLSVHPSYTFIPYDFWHWWIRYSWKFAQGKLVITGRKVQFATADKTVTVLQNTLCNDCDDTIKISIRQL